MCELRCSEMVSSYRSTNGTRLTGIWVNQGWFGLDRNLVYLGLAYTGILFIQGWSRLITGLFRACLDRFLVHSGVGLDRFLVYLGFA